MRNEGVIMKVRETMKDQLVELIYQGLDKEEIVKIVEEILDSIQKGEGKHD